MTRKIRLYQVDAFTTKRFSGNPAAVCILDHAIADDIMQQIAAEMNLSETAFVRRLPSSAGMEYSLRWFTPKIEVPLCGHATVATAAALLEGEGVECDDLRFQTVHSGALVVTKSSDELYHLSVPLLPPDTPSASSAQPCNAICEAVLGSLPQASCISVGHNRDVKYVFIALEGLSREQFEAWEPPLAQLKSIPSGDDIIGAIVSCAGGPSRPELLLRFLATWAGIDEDPVTGSAYAVAGPWWATRLGKTSFAARQCSKRGGDLVITVNEAKGRVDVAGGAVLVSEGNLYID